MFLIEATLPAACFLQHLPGCIVPQKAVISVPVISQHSVFPYCLGAFRAATRSSHPRESLKGARARSSQRPKSSLCRSDRSETSLSPQSAFTQRPVDERKKKKPANIPKFKRNARRWFPLLLLNAGSGTDFLSRTIPLSDDYLGRFVRCGCLFVEPAGFDSLLGDTVYPRRPRLFGDAGRISSLRILFGN